jgi:hypothetical protein
VSAVPKELFREHQVIGALEALCQNLELSESARKDAEAKYNAVAKHLSEGDHPALQHLSIYAHGSTAAGTTVKPIAKNEHDVDLVSLSLQFLRHQPPWELKQLIGKQLCADPYYASILTEKRRCWRLEYAGRIHLDITPAILNPDCCNGGELVPDKELRRWKPTNPRGYLRLFERRAALMPRIRFGKSVLEHRADIEPFPAHTLLKGVLRRAVQLGKRDRDVFFERNDKEHAVISIIITTLMAQAYERCVMNTYDTELQLLLAIIRAMPTFIVGPPTGHSQWAVWNETTEGENFAERWNEDAGYPTAFFRWHKAFLLHIEQLVRLRGIDQLSKSLTEAFGARPVADVMKAMTDSVSNARAAGSLLVVPSAGLSTSSFASGTAVRSNTFFGAR